MFFFFFFVQIILTKIKFNIKNPEESLRLLVADFENNQRSIHSIPKDFVDYFSIPGLVNSLNVQLSIPPKCNQAYIESEMRKKSFKNPNELAKYITSKFPKSLDRLYAIFYYEANNILYDEESYLSKSVKHKTLEEIFDTKLGVCADFSLFMHQMAEKCQIKDFEILEFFNLAKGYAFSTDPFNFYPNEPQPNHAAILVKYKNSIFLSEPTWAGGSLLSKYNPMYFLNPIEKLLSSHFPETNFKLPFSFSYEQFKRLLPYRMNDKDVKIESHLFWYYETHDGYMNFQFSCSPNVEDIHCQLNMFKETKIYYEYVNIETITSKRKRFIIHVTFPKSGLFELKLWLDNTYILTYYIKNTGPFKNAPIIRSSTNEYKFVPIEPKVLMTDVSSNYAMLKFVSIKDSSHRLIIKAANKDWYCTYLHEEELPVSGRNDLTEKWIRIPFEKPGIYKFQLHIDKNDSFASPFTVSYFFNVTKQNNHDSIPPIKSTTSKDRGTLKTEQSQDYYPNETIPYSELFLNTSKLIFQRGKDILTKIDYDNGLKKINDVMNNLKTIGQNAYDSAAAKEAKRKITEYSNKLILISKDMYDNFDCEGAKEKLKESTNKLMLKVKELANSFDSKDAQKKVNDISENLKSYGKQVINNLSYETNNQFDKVKKIYNKFDYEKTVKKVKDIAIEKYLQSSQFFKNLLS